VRLLLAAIAVTAVCGTLFYTGRVKLPFLAPTAAAASRDVKNHFEAAADDGEVKQRPRSVSCDRSHAIDYAKKRVAFGFTAAFSCSVTWADGSEADFCFLAKGSRTVAASLPSSCEAAAEGGWARG
jgi:hypothetical protein